MVDSFEELLNKWDLPLGKSIKPKPLVPSLPPLPKPRPSPPPVRPVMEAVVRVGSQVSLDLDGIPEGLLKDVQRHLTFRNPLHKAMVRAGRHDPKITEHLTCWHVQEGSLVITIPSALAHILLFDKVGLCTLRATGKNWQLAQKYGR